MEHFKEQNNRAKSYYPEALNFNEQTEQFSPSYETQNAQSQNNSQQHSNGMNFESLFNLFGKNSNQNDMLSTILASGMLGGGGQNPAMMQALTQMLGNKKTPSTESKAPSSSSPTIFEEI